MCIGFLCEHLCNFGQFVSMNISVHPQSRCLLCFLIVFVITEYSYMSEKVSVMTNQNFKTFHGLFQVVPFLSTLCYLTCLFVQRTRLEKLLWLIFTDYFVRIQQDITSDCQCPLCLVPIIFFPFNTLTSIVSTSRQSCKQVSTVNFSLKTYWIQTTTAVYVSTPKISMTIAMWRSEFRKLSPTIRSIYIFPKY